MALDLLSPLSEVYMELGGESESGNFVPYLDIQDCYYPDNWNWEIAVQSLSKQLQTRTIYYWVGNAVELGYRCWDSGVLVEQLEYDEGEVEGEMDDEEPNFQLQVFVSQLSNLTAQDIEDAYDFMDDFFISQQVYVLTRMHNLKREDFQRLDFVTWTETVRLRG